MLSQVWSEGLYGDLSEVNIIRLQPRLPEPATLEVRHGNLYFNKILQVILWPPDAKSWLTGKDPDAGRDWEQEEKGTTEDEMAGWRHRLDGHEFEWTPGVGDGQGGLACCGSWGHRVRPNWVTELNWTVPGDSYALVQVIILRTAIIPEWGGGGGEVLPRNSDNMK